MNIINSFTLQCHHYIRQGRQYRTKINDIKLLPEIASSYHSLSWVGTKPSGVDCGLDYGLDYGLDNFLVLRFKVDYECRIAQ